MKVMEILILQFFIYPLWPFDISMLDPTTNQEATLDEEFNQDYFHALFQIREHTQE